MAYPTICLSMPVYSKVAHAAHLPHPRMTYHTIGLSRLSHNTISPYMGRGFGRSRYIRIGRGINIGKGIILYYIVFYHIVFYSIILYCTQSPYPKMAYPTIGLSMLVYSKVAHATHLPCPRMAYPTIGSDM